MPEARLGDGQSEDHRDFLESASPQNSSDHLNAQQLPPDSLTAYTHRVSRQLLIGAKHSSRHKKIERTKKGARFLENHYEEHHMAAAVGQW